MRSKFIVVFVSVMAAACSYQNVLHNANNLFFRGESARLAGRDSLASERYNEVVTKTGEALRDRPQSEWANKALVLHGRARLRLGELREAQAALTDAVRLNPPESDEARVYLAAVKAEIGDVRSALEGVNRALSGTLEDLPRFEAHFLRGRLLLEQGMFEQAGWDLDRASEAGLGMRAEADLEVLRWSIVHREEQRASDALDVLMENPRAGGRTETMGRLVDKAADTWGQEKVASMLEGVNGSEWDRVARGKMALARARMLSEAGDTSSARIQATDVASGIGRPSVDARLLLAKWQLQQARDLDTVYGVRVLLLPVGRDGRAAEQVESINIMESLTDLGYEQPLGFFAAAELARDRLGADYVARGLFIAYASAAPYEPWAPKALLAALNITPEPADRAWLKERLEANPNSPYVLAASGGPSAGYQQLEEELDLRLRALTQR
ncbi:MAG TPA: hypothetical protein DCS75_08045 [Gemmatimonadetes bacterium]|nr:hypothetical protein [Gemmatimonadota bacterium]